MGRAGGVLQFLAQHHVAAAFAVDRPGLGELPQAGTKARGGGQLGGVQFRIAARQPAGIATIRRRFVGERRERLDFRPRLPPGLQ